MFWKISEGIKLLAQHMVDNPHEWTQGDYDFKNKDIGIWTANGDSYVKINGNDCLTYAEKRHLSAAIKKAIALKRIKLTLDSNNMAVKKALMNLKRLAEEK